MLPNGGKTGIFSAHTYSLSNITGKTVILLLFHDYPLVVIFVVVTVNNIFVMLSFAGF